MSEVALPSFYIPHGGGPCFFMEWTMGPPDTWDRLRDWLAGLIGGLPRRPRALLVISAHWEEQPVAVTGGQAPDLIYDYYGFPPHTYELTWPAPGDPALAARVATLLEAAGIPCRLDAERGFDHGVFVPAKVMRPEADIPTLALSLRIGLDPEIHLAIGEALAPLRRDDV
ncbi:MAG TPA: class III extradiol ring-cleavage dioxygenase, partial [Alphaproteobacteria bacterium]|nr:class III extradiol ring-cleavage dioxygenase [Alphaproteobacteria bacterium]